MGLELHGIVERNFAFEEFLQFGESNQLTVMNTCFEKKTMHHGTWVSVETGSGHPGHIFSGSSGSDPVYNLSGSDPDWIT